MVHAHPTPVEPSINNLDQEDLGILYGHARGAWTMLGCICSLLPRNDPDRAAMETGLEATVSLLKRTGKLLGFELVGFEADPE